MRNPYFENSEPPKRDKWCLIMVAVGLIAALSAVKTCSSSAEAKVVKETTIDYYQDKNSDSEGTYEKVLFTPTSEKE